MNADLLSIQKIVTADGRRNRYLLELSGMSEEDRKAVIAAIEDRSEASKVEFNQWSREWKTFYLPETTEFRMMQVIDLVLIAPLDMDPTGIGCFILSIVS